MLKAKQPARGKKKQSTLRKNGGPLATGPNGDGDGKDKRAVEPVDVTDPPPRADESKRGDVPVARKKSYTGRA